MILKLFSSIAWLISGWFSAFIELINWKKNLAIYFQLWHYSMRTKQSSDVWKSFEWIFITFDFSSLCDGSSKDSWKMQLKHNLILVQKLKPTHSFYIMYIFHKLFIVSSYISNTLHFIKIFLLFFRLVEISNFFIKVSLLPIKWNGV